MDSITVLDNAILELMQTQIILADKSVKKVLIALSKSEDYCRTIRDASKGFDFDREFTRYYVTEKHAPKSGHLLIALVTGTLYKIDSGKLNLLDFLKAAYPSADTTKSYPMFINDYIIPFVDALNIATFGQPYDDVKMPKVNSYDKLKEEVKWAVNRIIKEKLSNIDYDINDEVISMFNGFNHSVALCDNLMIKTAFTGLENTLYRYNINLDEELANLRNTLTIYGVI